MTDTDISIFEQLEEMLDEELPCILEDAPATFVLRHPGCTWQEPVCDEHERICREAQEDLRGQGYKLVCGLGHQITTDDFTIHPI